jgi:hypothetical protein
MNSYSRNYLRIKDSRRDYRDREDMRYDRNYRQDMRSGNDYRGRNDYAEYDSRQDYRDYADYNMDRDYGDYEQHRQHDMAYEDMRSGRSNYRPVEAMGYFNGYYDMGGQDYYSGRDGHNKLSKKDI